MCRYARESEDGWRPVVLRLGWARARPKENPFPGKAGSMRVRILCGAYDATSPFIEGGCAEDLIEDLDGTEDRLDCPRCRQHCPGDFVGCAREMLATRVVFVIGCHHRAFTFSRRTQEPYFSPHDAPGSRRGG